MLPVLGSTVITTNRDVAGPRVTALIHGVRRIPGATVLYFSVGLPTGTSFLSWNGLTRPQSDLRYSSNSTQLGNEQLIDMAGNRVYSVLVDAQRNALASPMTAWPAAGPAGQFYELYEVLPQLPADLHAVDVMIGNGDVVHDVPVSDGVMQPAVPQTGPLKLGQGWPQIDQAAAAASMQPEESIRPLHTETSDLAQTVVKRSTSNSVSVDLSADVLFAVDSATLNGNAAATVKAAADQINANAGPGRIQVVGHTDATGTASHNNDLSTRRAQAVAKALQPLVTAPGMSFVIMGVGEAGPVASNNTPAGRRANRRVSVVFTPRGAK